MTTNRLAKSENVTRPRLSPEAFCEIANAHLLSEGRRDVQWLIRDDKPVLDWVVRPSVIAHGFKHPMDRRGEPMNAEDTRILNRCLEEAGATARYMPDGSKYRVDRVNKAA